MVNLTNSVFLVAFVYLNIVTQWVGVKEEAYFCENKGCYQEHNFVLTQDAHRQTNYVIKFILDGVTNDVTFKCSMLEENRYFSRNVDFTYGPCIEIYQCH